MREKLKLQACIRRFFSEGSSIFVVQWSNNNLDPAAYISVNWKPYPTCLDTEDILLQERDLFNQISTKQTFSFGLFSPLIPDTASYPPFSFPVCSSSSPGVLKGSWTNFPAHVGLGAAPATLPPHSTRALWWQGSRAPSFPLCPWKIPPSKSQCIKFTSCLTAQNVFSNSSFSAKTLAIKSCHISYFSC